MANWWDEAPIVEKPRNWWEAAPLVEEPQEGPWTKYQRREGPWTKYQQRQRPRVDPRTNQPPGVPEYVPPGVEGYDPQTGEVNRQRDPSFATAGFSGFVEGIPIAGPFLQSGVENVAAGIGSLLTGRPQRDVRGEMGQMVQQSQAHYPGTTTTANVTGALAGTMPAVLAAPTAFGAGSGPLLTRSLMGAISGGLVGGADAGVRGNSIPMGAGLGTALGAAGPGISDLIGRGVSAAGRRMAGVNPAQQRFARAIRADGIDDPGAVMRQLGPDAMPMDLGPNLQRQAGALAATPGSNQQTIRSAIRDRITGAGGRVTSALDDALGQPVDTIGVANDIIARRSAAAKPLYGAAYRKPVPFTSELESLLKRPSAARALGQAQRLAADDQTFNQGTRGWFANIADDGTVTIRRTPSVYELDMTKRSLDDMISSAQRGGNNNEARIFTQLKNDLVRMVDDAVPEYRAAREAFSGPAAVLDALEEGQNVFSRNLTPQQLRRQLDGMGAAEKDAFIQGARAEIAKTMGTARNDALAARSLFDKGWNKEKLEIILGPERAGRMLQSMDAEAAFTRTRDVVTGNSETAARLAAQQDVGTGAMAEPGFLRSLFNFKAGDAAASAIDRGLGGVRSASQTRANEQLAQLLTSRDPQAISSMVQRVQAAQSRGDITAQRAQEIIQSLMVGGGARRPFDDPTQMGGRRNPALKQRIIEAITGGLNLSP